MQIAVTMDKRDGQSARAHVSIARIVLDFDSRTKGKSQIERAFIVRSRIDACGMAKGKGCARTANTRVQSGDS